MVMAHRPRHKPPQNHGSPKVLLIDRCKRTSDVRALFLRDHGIEVEAAEELEEARFFFQSKRFDLVLLDVRRYLPGQALDFCRLVKDIDPDQLIAFLLGPPRYISVNWPEKFTATGELSRHWQAATKHAAAA
jgi:response regulator RpfG family c-di-GMP phosphodiesterase